MATASELKAANRAVLLDPKDAFGSNYPADLVRRLDSLIDNIFAVTGPSPHVKIYVALLNQESTEDVNATVLNNNYGAGVTWSRNDIGDYIGTEIGAFEMPTSIVIGPLENPGFVTARKVSNDVISVKTFDIAGEPADGLLEKTVIELRSYILD